MKASLSNRLRSNIQNTWLSSLIYSPRTSSIYTDLESLELLNKRQTISQPFGLACINKADKDSTSAAGESLVHEFVSSSDATKWFDYWIRERRIWWKRLTFDCGRFDVKNVSDRRCSIMFDDTVICEDVEMLEGPQKSFQTVRTSLYLNTALSCFLQDATASSDKKVIKLHYQLTPYQISVTYTTKTMMKTAMRLIGDLKLMRISVYPAVSQTKASSNSHFHEMDALGVYLNIILGEDTEESGVVNVRCRDTHTMEKLHVTTVPEYLCKCLKSDGRVEAEEFKPHNEVDAIVNSL